MKNGIIEPIKRPIKEFGKCETDYQLSFRLRINGKLNTTLFERCVLDAMKKYSKIENTSFEIGQMKLEYGNI